MFPFMQCMMSEYVNDLSIEFTTLNIQETLIL